MKCSPATREFTVIAFLLSRVRPVRRGFPFFTGRDQRQMIRYRARFRNPEKAARPVNLSEAEKLGSGVNPISAGASELMIDVETPDGKTFAIDDPALIDNLRANIDGNHELTLLRSDKAITDCRPLSIFAVQTAKKLGEETGLAVDKRRFRANIYVDLTSSEGFAEDEFVGRSLRIGSKVTVAVLQRDGRCMMITLDPDTAEKTPAILKAVAQAHEGMAGVYGAVLVEGMIRKGDPVELLDCFPLASPGIVTCRFEIRRFPPCRERRWSKPMPAGMIAKGCGVRHGQHWRRRHLCCRKECAPSRSCARRSRRSCYSNATS